MEQKEFRASIFGFKRADVVHYIEELVQEHTVQQRQIEQLLNEKSTLVSDNEALHTDVRNLQATLQEMQKQMNLAKENTEAAEQACDRAQKNNELLTMRATDLEEQLAETDERIDTLLQENRVLQEQNEEYIKMRASITELELNAQQRAKKIEDYARESAKKIQVEAEGLLGAVRKRLEAAREDYRATVRRSQEEIERLERTTGEAMQHLDAGTAVIAEAATEEAAKERLQNVLSNIRKKTVEED